MFRGKNAHSIMIAGCLHNQGNVMLMHAQVRYCILRYTTNNMSVLCMVSFIINNEYFTKVYVERVDVEYRDQNQISFSLV